MHLRSVVRALKDVLRPGKRALTRWARTPRDYAAIRALHAFRTRFGEFPGVLAVGAYAGLGTWQIWAERQLVRAIGIEPNTTECAFLNRRHPGAKFYPFGLAGHTGKATLYLTEFPQCYSCREPDFDTLDRYPVARWFRVRGTAEIDVYRFDELYPKQLPWVPDVVDIDVQGLEREVLEGFGEHLGRVACVKLETRLKPAYKGEMLLPELVRWMDARGFMLRDLRPTKAVWEGELVEFDAYFRRREPDERARAVTTIWEAIERTPTPIQFKDVAFRLDQERSRGMG
jgi:FkbM family methyltransferase